MYNLAHLYIYEIKTAEKINESIELLIKSSNQNFEPSKYLLCKALINKHNFDFDKILNELMEKSYNLAMPIIEIILELNLLEKTIDYLYGIFSNSVDSKTILKH